MVWQVSSTAVQQGALSINMMQLPQDGATVLECGRTLGWLLVQLWQGDGVTGRVMNRSM